MYNMGVKIPKYSLAQNIFDKSITTVATSEVGIAYPSEHLSSPPVFCVVHIEQSLVFCVIFVAFCRSLLVFCPFL